MANLYLAEELPATAFAPGATVEIGGDEAHHAVRVSRLRAGERILVGNGAGALAEGEAILVEKQRFVVRIESVTEQAPPAPRLTLVQALAKGDRAERAVEQATEFGVDAITPWGAERSVSRWSGAEKAERGAAKWRRIAREAAKQSLRPWLPEVNEPIGIAELAAAAARADTAVLLLHPRGELALSAWAPDADIAALAEIRIVIGPEGGFSDAELDTLEGAGATILVLGETVLRTSSAGPAALAVLNAALGRW
ncbi:16S rRNA (uracil(1498)-N(3))-methyltransferase [Leucobacter chromiireducens]|uniref:16S rRNA (uracil(1498)-N(3))-methyltransferase n=1 Tax=Leucobacter chromiireducens TaxID=283877 RepID=UPI000F6349BC|nr:16S rRNA (uracil(1498)-N(3))-methyltransferase [Leucobacter chromiireducens]